jgi:hypothetical protein
LYASVCSRARKLLLSSSSSSVDSTAVTEEVRFEYADRAGLPEGLLVMSTMIGRDQGKYDLVLVAIA